VIGMTALLALIVVAALRPGRPSASLSPVPREAARRRLLESDVCSWMWGDAGDGLLGHKAAEMDPLRWKTMRCEAIAADLERYNTSENSLRPVEMEVGRNGGKRIFQNIDEAISYLHQRDEFYKWMWGDTDGPLLHKLAEIDPFRWSAWMTAHATIEDLRKYEEEESSRPVEVLLGKTGSSQQFKNIDAAIQFLSQREGGRPGDIPAVALAFAVAACVLLSAAASLGLYLCRLRRQTAGQECARFLPVGDKESAMDDNEERTPPDTAIGGWWLAGLGALLLGGVVAGLMAAVFWDHAGNHPSRASTQPSNACLGAADQDVWNHGGSHDFDSVMKECSTPCMGKSGCVATCIQRREKYTDACVRCMGDLAGCTAANCMFQCMSGAGPSCVQCAKSSCKPAFKLCSGLSH